jgi:hypothetical protein
MKRTTLIARTILIALLLTVSPVLAEDRGQWEAYRLTPQQKQWFKSVQDAAGISCCSVADGHPITTYEKRADGHYWIWFDHEWRQVPDHAVRKSPNPVGVAVAWFYVFMAGPWGIRCFVPAPET